MKRTLAIGRRTLLLATLLLVLAPAAAEAGSYSVVGGCGGNWIPHGGVTGMTIYAECPNLVVRNVGGHFSTPWGVLEYWEFLPPAGTLVGSVSMTGRLTGRNGWEAFVMADQGLVLEKGPGPTCSGGSVPYSLLPVSLGRAQLALGAWCIRALWCPNDKLDAYADARSIVVQILDSTAPAVVLTGGNLTSGWRRGRGVVTVRASDNVGIKADRLLIDGVPREQRARACRWGTLIPCPNGAGSLSFDTRRLADGVHTLTVQAVDSANNIAGQSSAIRLDNTAPTVPSSAALAGGTGWRRTNSFTTTWVNPPQSYASIAAVRYRMCPLANSTADTRGCVGGVSAAPDAHTLANLAEPRPGAWRMRFWLV